MHKLSILRDIVRYFAAGRRLWLLPAVLAILALGVLTLLTSHAVVAPFIYTLF